MESGLHERDLVGVQDFVLLENYQSEEAFIDNLKTRFQSNLIYVSNEPKYCANDNDRNNSWEYYMTNSWYLFLLQTYIGQVLVSVNPYKELNIYSEQDIKEYRGKHFFETPPHM